MISRRFNRKHGAFSALARSTVLLAVVAGCATSPGRFVWIDEVAAPVLNTEQQPYQIVANDVLMVQVFNHPEMSGKNRVRSDGNVSVGLLGDVQAVGKQPTSLARDIEKELDTRKLAVGARVTIVLDEAAPVRVSIIGEVAQPGLYSLEPGAGLAEALASSGGFTDFAHRDRLYVLRRAPTLLRIRFRFQDLIQGKGNAMRFRLRSGDTIVAE